jgi:hypothetical protein
MNCIILIKFKYKLQIIAISVYAIEFFYIVWTMDFEY